MTYSQKYCLVHFISPIDNNAQFDMSEWPPHITLADVFAIDRKNSDIDTALKSVCEQSSQTITTVINESILGETPVMLLETTPKLLKLHSDIITVLENHDAIFNTPAFTRDGFIPHSTIQDNNHLEIGQQITIDTISLIDMFPDGDWQQRKVLATFNLK